MAESERKYEDIARKLATMEGELERSNDRFGLFFRLLYCSSKVIYNDDKLKKET